MVTWIVFYVSFRFPLASLQILGTSMILIALRTFLPQRSSNCIAFGPNVQEMIVGLFSHLHTKSYFIKVLQQNHPRTHMYAREDRGMPWFISCAFTSVLVASNVDVDLTDLNGKNKVLIFQCFRKIS